MRGESPRQMRWGTTLAAWRDPAEMQAAEVIDNLSAIADIPAPSSEAVARELAPLPPKEQPRDRFNHAPSPVRILMKDGVWLAPESDD